MRCSRRPPTRTITPQAQKRLDVLQSLDTLGAGFQLASHDLDIRGAGNLLGDEQSGHIREVGYELYQQMLADAITLLKAGIEEPQEEAWSPTIAIGAPVTIPEDYVADLTLRLQLYRRLSTLETDQDIEAFAAEMIDRFGPIPPEVEQLLEIVAIKALCRRAHVEKIDAGPKGVIVAFREDKFANPGRARALCRGAADKRQGASRHARGVHPRVREHETAARRHAPNSPRARRDRGEEGCLSFASQPSGGISLVRRKASWLSTIIAKQVRGIKRFAPNRSLRRENTTLKSKVRLRTVMRLRDDSRIASRRLICDKVAVVQRSYSNASG